MAQTNTKTVRRKRKVRLLTRNGQYYDYNLLACVVLLTCFGLIMLYSTSAYDAQVEYGSDTYFLFRQALFSVGGLAAIFVFSMIDYHLRQICRLFLPFQQSFAFGYQIHRSRGKRCKTMDQNWSDPVSVSRTCQTGNHSVPFCTDRAVRQKVKRL